MLLSNAADKVDRPKTKKYVGKFYDKDEIGELLECVRGTKIETPVMVAAFYGLRRSEVMGLKWDAIDFEKKTITIQHTVTQVHIDGHYRLLQKNTTKNSASRRTLPLVDRFYGLFHSIQAEQKENQRVCGNCYNTSYNEYIFVDEMGNLLKPDYVSSCFKRILRDHSLRPIRFHDLRHPYVKYTTKKYYISCRNKSRCGNNTSAFVMA